MNDDPAPTTVTESLCRNCQQPLHGNFCAYCGQDDREVKRPFFWLIRDTLKVLFDLDSRAYVTLYYLLTRPAFLSREYVANRRASYTPPLRLFLVITIGFLVIVSVVNELTNIQTSLNTQPASSQAEAVAPEAPTVVLDGEEADTFLTQIMNFIDDFNLGILSEEGNDKLHELMRQQATANFEALQENPQEFLFGALDYLTFFILLMIPVLALIQKLLYVGSGRYYIEHLVLTLHNHTFVMLALFLIFIIGSVQDLEIPVVSAFFNLAGTVLNFWVIIYLFLSLKLFFEQGYVITAVKFLITSILYGLIFSGGIAAFAILFFFLV